MNATETVYVAPPQGEDAYQQFLAGIQARYLTLDGPLFTTDAADLFAVFLAALPVAERQYYTCNCCRQFLERFAGLVQINPDGRTAPAFWDVARVGPEFEPVVAALYRAVSRAKVTGVFLSSDKAWGTPKTGEWRHMAVIPEAGRIFRHGVKNAGQIMAEKLEEYGMLQRGLAELPAEAVAQAATLLQNGSLYRSEKCIGVAKWLEELHAARASVKGTTMRENLVWLAVAKAPAGFCHVRSGMIGTLLEDIVAGMAFDTIKRRFDEKMSPTQYMRPTAAPSAGNIAQAEKIVAELRSAGALDRRYARLDEVQAVWTPVPKAEEKPAGGVFGHLKPKESTPVSVAVNATPVTMTWEKFQRTILGDAVAIEVMTPHRNGPFYPFVTATDLESLPLLQWDHPEKRNPVSWYTQTNGTPAGHWTLPTAAYVPVSAVCLWPHMWDGSGQFSRHGDGVGFVLADAKIPASERGQGFFPEFLRSEYHAVRATMEAHAKSAPPTGHDQGVVVYGCRKGSAWDCVLRVTGKNGVKSIYRLDRWD